MLATCTHGSQDPLLQGKAVPGSSGSTGSVQGEMCIAPLPECHEKHQDRAEGGGAKKRGKYLVKEKPGEASLLPFLS